MTKRLNLKRILVCAATFFVLVLAVLAVTTTASANTAKAPFRMQIVDEFAAIRSKHYDTILCDTKTGVVYYVTYEGFPCVMLNKDGTPLVMEGLIRQ